VSQRRKKSALNRICKIHNKIEPVQKKIFDKTKMQKSNNNNNNVDYSEMDEEALEQLHAQQQEQQAAQKKVQAPKEVSDEDLVELTDDQADMFRKGSAVIFANWSVIRLTIENEACGHDTKEMVDDFRDRLTEWLIDEGLLGLTAQDVQEYMSEVFAEDLGVDVEDGSVMEVAKMLLDMLSKCHKNEFGFIEKLLKDQEEKIKMYAAYDAQKKQENAQLEQFLDNYVPSQDAKQVKKQQAKIDQMKNLMLSDDEDDDDDEDGMEGADDDQSDEDADAGDAGGWSTVQQKKKK